MKTCKEMLNEIVNIELEYGAKLNQQIISKNTGINKNTISNIIRGKELDIRMSTYKKILNFYNELLAKQDKTVDNSGEQG